MSSTLCISFRFVQPYPLFHGRDEAGEPEWPPSPMRAFQALLNSAGLRTRGTPFPSEVRWALQVIEVLRPTIVAPRANVSSIGHRTYVPHNHGDLVLAAWARGDSTSSMASHRIEKDFHPHRLEGIGDGFPTLHYLYPLNAAEVDPAALLAAIRPSVRSIHCLGWGIDQVVADATLIESSAVEILGEKWVPAPAGGKRLRVHRSGSLDALTARHDSFLRRLDQGCWTPVPPLRQFDHLRYRRANDPLPRPHAVFKLIDAEGGLYRYPHRKFIHIAGMVRHLAIVAMKRCPPLSIASGPDWVERYVAGHRDANEKAAVVPHSQLAYVPLPSIGHHHADPAIRRVMIIAPVGDDANLEHVCRYLDGARLESERESDLREPVFLQRADEDNVVAFYTQPGSGPQGYNRWASVTPVVLPGHDDYNPKKTRKLIERALAQSGVDQPCEFEWSPFSHFPKMLTAYKYDRQGRLAGYIRPHHLLNQTAVHLTLRFDGDARVPGPLTLGSGRFCGFGLMAGIA